MSRLPFIAIALLCAGPAAAQVRVNPVGIAPVPAAVSDSAARPHDSLLGLDKPKHFLLSAFVQSFAFASLQSTGLKYSPDMAAASLLTAAVDLGKELHDRKTTGLFSFGDLFWDAAGAATASVMLRHTHR
jgi:uncharacterized protein YfiM (DUF2279 family)